MTAPASFTTVFEALRGAFPQFALASAPLMQHGASATSQWAIVVPPQHVVPVMTWLRDQPSTAFDQLCDLTCLDYLNYPSASDRYGVTYNIVSTTHNHRVWLKSYVNDPTPTVPSVVGIWPGADWLEREVFDMFGIVFDGHPDLRRILTWDGFEAHPLRKDYPLRGRGEREAYDIVTRDSA